MNILQAHKAVCQVNQMHVAVLEKLDQTPYGRSMADTLPDGMESILELELRLERRIRCA